MIVIDVRRSLMIRHVCRRIVPRRTRTWAFEYDFWVPTTRRGHRRSVTATISGRHAASHGHRSRRVAYRASGSGNTVSTAVCIMPTL